jgi:DNA-binding NarL/FixJ family response regulator
MTAMTDRFAPKGMRGREHEQSTVRDLLRRVARGGGGGVVLVEGEPGTGKSRLLREVAAEATGDGFSLAAGVADQLGQTIPLFALRAALGEPFARFTAGRDDQDPRQSPDWWIDDMRAHLEQRAAAAPVLVCMDDLQWACLDTLGALRTLPRVLEREPVAWVLARSTAPQQDTEYLFDVLEKDGAARIGLSPLDDDAVAALLADAFGAPPDQSLMALAGEAAGNPSLLVELIDGLRDDNVVRETGGRAVLSSGALPPRVHRVARQRLDGLSQPARHLLVTAAVLGPSFRLEDAAEMMGETPGALLPAVEEAMAGGIMTAAGNVLYFRHQLLRRAIGDLIPKPGRTALHRQYGHLLLSRGEPAVQAAGHLLLAADPRDQTSLADLDIAVTKTSQSAPRTAADLALRALELTPAADPEALPRAVAAAEALAAAGRLDQAARIAQVTLGKPLPPVAEARLRCALSSVLCSRGRSEEAAAEAGLALAQPRLPPGLHDQATAAQLRALAELRDERAGPMADRVLASGSQPDGHVVVAALAARAVRSWDSGRISQALELMRDAARHDAEIRRDARHGQPLLALAAALIDLRQLGEAEDILHAVSSQTMGGVPAQAALSVLRARIHFVTGKLADADAAAQGALATADAVGAHGHAAAAHRVLGLIALRRGDIAAAADHVAGNTAAAPQPASLDARIETALIQAHISEARGDKNAAVGHVSQACADLVSHPGLLLRAPATATWLVRTALAAGDARLAAVVTGALEILAADNPGYAAITATVAHSLGLAAQDAARLAEAAARHRDPWARASAAEDVGVLLARQGDRATAIQALTRAVEGYQSTGAATDAARVRRRLRGLGVRRRHWTQPANRPVTGWESLTDTERSVSELVAQGLTNRQIAARMYLSASTVAFHLRQIFRKLDLGSRVELARVVIQHAATSAPLRRS